MKNSFQLKAFLTFLSRNKLYTAVNLCGFAVSLAFVLLLGLYLQREYAVDADQPNADRIFKLTTSAGNAFAPPAAADLQNRYPEIERTLRVGNIELNDITVTREGTKERFSGEALFVDTTFLQMFSFPLVEGTPQSVMRTKQDVVLTESFAKKLFGDAPAIGKTISLADHMNPFTVSGVVVDLKNTHFRNPAVLAPFPAVGDYYGAPYLVNFWGWCMPSLYLQARPGTDLPAKVDDMLSYFQSNGAYWLYGRDSTLGVQLTPLREAYFETSLGAKHNHNTNDASWLRVLGFMALLVLVFALANYVNLSMAQTGFRAKEAAMRRLLGGTRGGLFFSFILESLLLCVVSFGLALVLASALEPWFQQVMNSSVALSGLLTPLNILVMLAGIVLLGVLAGILPALVIVRFQPIEVVKGTFRRRTKMVYSKVLIATQYAITIALIGCTFTILRQVHFMRTTDLGYNTDFIIGFSNPVGQAQQSSLQAELLRVPGVEQVVLSNGYPPRKSNNNSFEDGDRNAYSFQIYEGDSSFMSLMGFHVLHRTGVEDADAVWFNETAWKMAKLAPDATEWRVTDQWKMKLKGYVRDFHSYGLDRPIGAEMIRPFNPQGTAWNVLVKVSPADPFGAFDRVRETTVKFAGGDVFDGEFLDQTIAHLYETQNRMSKIMGWLTIVALAISTMGMLAMATYFIRQRTQQIAIRKVFGSTEAEVLVRLLRSFLWLVVVAFVVAAPAIALLMQRWLSNYTYRISLSWQIFAVAFLAAFVVALVAVLWNALQAAYANPVKSLKSE